MRANRYFNDYGYLEWLSESDYFDGDWSYVGEITDCDGDTWSLVYSRSRYEYRYTCI